MTQVIRIGLVGDFSDGIVAHEAIPMALNMAAKALALPLDVVWMATQTISKYDSVIDPSEGEIPFSDFHGFWCVPGSPYRSTEGALTAIRYAREQRTPFLGTCAGFQHAIIEYARNVLGWSDAEHAETAPDAERAVISPLACPLVEQTETVTLRAGSRLAAAYGKTKVREGYHCSFGVNPTFRSALVAGALKGVGDDDTGALRAVELDGHPFFVATLFQPERGALRGDVPPIVSAFVRAARVRSSQRPA